jgi:hypothetical protein
MKHSALTSAHWLIATVVIVFGLVLLSLGCSNKKTQPGSGITGVTTADCSQCHGSASASWDISLHADTQDDVAGELAAERAGQTPDEVLHGADAENCIACHGPLAVKADSSMTESEAMSYFFSTEGGKFTSNTQALHKDEWSHVDCEVCHNAPDGHPAVMPTLALFNSSTASYIQMTNASTLCGQCHGSLRFADTDHLTHDAWSASRHAQTQQDVADELAAERAGESPHEVLAGSDPENCIACHGPTAVLANGGMSEEEALGYFFTTTGGVFTQGTAPDHADEWPDVSCSACHDPHHPEMPSYFNSATRQYEPMMIVDRLCGQCHGSLRFPDTDHLSYDIRTGEGGINVPAQQLMPSAGCADCHMFVSDVDGSNSSMMHGHRFAITVDEGGGASTTSCTRCHPSWDTATAQAKIDQFKTEFGDLDATTAANVAAAAQALVGSSDAGLLAKLEEAQHNLEYAESDESGGFHNHTFLMALLNDANQRALEILAAP